MTTLQLSTCQVQYYSSLDEFPVGRRAYWTRYLLENSAMDTDLDSLRGRIGDLRSRLAQGQTADVDQGLVNLFYSLNAIEMNYDPASLAFAVLVARVDDEPQTDLTPEGLARLVSRLSAAGLTDGQVVDAVETVKKNSIPSENAIFLGLLTTPTEA